MRERCPVCLQLRQPSRVRRLQPIETDTPVATRFLNTKRVGHEGELGQVSVRRMGMRFRYACSRGHEFDGEHFHDDAWVRARHGGK